MTAVCFVEKVVLLAVGAVVFFLPASSRCFAESGPREVSFIVRTMKETNIEGPDVERTYFVIAGKRVVFGTPKGCRLSVEGKDLVILPGELELDGEIRVSPSQFAPELDLAANALKYRDAAASKIPRTAVGIEVQQPVMNPFPYNGWKSLGFTWNYSLNGRALVRTVSYVNLELGIQLVVTEVAGKADAKKLSAIAQQFMRSWWVTEL